MRRNRDHEPNGRSGDSACTVFAPQKEILKTFFS